MKSAAAFLMTAVAGIFAFACSLHGDDTEKTPGRDNPVLKSILAPELRITGRWKGVVRRGYEEHHLTIEKDPDQKDAYRLKFYTWTDIAGARKAKRTGKLVDGRITLNEPIEGFGISKSPFSVFYTVRADGKDYLLPSVNAEELKTVDDVKPRVAYQFERRTEK